MAARTCPRSGPSPAMTRRAGMARHMARDAPPGLLEMPGITPENVEPMILDALADSTLFALRFRQNAARALLLPRSKIGKRAPLWLQRLRGRDLLQVARQHPDFPIVVETYRECLHDHLDMPRLQELLGSPIMIVRIILRLNEVGSWGIDRGSPVTGNLLWGIWSIEALLIFAIAISIARKIAWFALPWTPGKILYS